MRRDDVPVGKRHLVKSIGPELDIRSQNCWYRLGMRRCRPCRQDTERERTQERGKRFSAASSRLRPIHSLSP